MKRWLLVVVAVLAAACAPSGAVAVVDGSSIEREELQALHPEDADLDESRIADSVYLLVLHRLLVTAAAADYGFEASTEEVQVAFDERMSGFSGDPDSALFGQGVTRDRVMIEAELDVLRAAIEEQIIRDEGYDLDAAYRSFLAINSRVCLRGLLLTDEALVGQAEALIDDTDDVDVVAEGLALEASDIGCSSPTAHGALASVALDGELGGIYGPIETGVGFVVAQVVERDAPALDDVREEVTATAIETQGPELFTDWAVGVLTAADVTVDDSIGTWEATDETAGIPTVIPAG